MVTTKHCCYGVCRLDSRFSDRMKGVFFHDVSKTQDEHGESKTLGKCLSVCPVQFAEIIVTILQFDIIF